MRYQLVMSVVDSLKECVKGLYHDGIRTVGRYVAPVALAGVLTFTACGPSAPPTSTPTPRIQCDETRGTHTPYCEKSGQRILSFSGRDDILLGDTTTLILYASKEISKSSKVRIMYKTPGLIDGKRIERKRELLAILPTDTEVSIPFKPGEVGLYTFFSPDIDIEGKKDEFDIFYLTVDRGYIKVSLSVNKELVNVYEPITISGKINPPLISSGGSGWGELSIYSVHGTERWQLDKIDETLEDGEFNFQWVPDKLGEYRIELVARASNYMKNQTSIKIRVK